MREVGNKTLLGGLSDLEVVEIDDNEKYTITEYDGSESLQVWDSMNWN